MRKNKKQRRIMFLLILILGVTIGFALLSTTLKINGVAGINKNTWNIHWDDESIEETTGSVTATTPANVIDSEKKNISFEVELELPGDFYEFTVDAKNYGSVDGAISEIKTSYYEDGSTEPSAVPSYLNFSVTYADNGALPSGDILKAGQSKKYKVRLEYKSSETAPQVNPTLGRFEIEVPYEQHKTKKVTYFTWTTSFIYKGRETNCDAYTSREEVNYYGLDAASQYYFKFDKEDNIVTNMNLEFVINSTTMGTTTGMTPGLYSVAGWTDESSLSEKPIYDANKQALLTAFGNDNCTVYDNYVRCSSSVIGVEVHTDGEIKGRTAIIGRKAHCIIGNNYAYCDYNW